MARAAAVARVVLAAQAAPGVQRAGPAHRRTTEPLTDATAAAASSIRTVPMARWLRATPATDQVRAAGAWAVPVTSTTPRIGFAAARASVRTDVGAFEVQP